FGLPSTPPTHIREPLAPPLPRVNRTSRVQTAGLGPIQQEQRRRLGGQGIPGHGSDSTAIGQTAGGPAGSGAEAGGGGYSATGGSSSSGAAPADGSSVGTASAAPAAPAGAGGGGGGGGGITASGANQP